jgi:Flp pilus assembly protein TadB
MLSVLGAAVPGRPRRAPRATPPAAVSGPAGTRTTRRAAPSRRHTALALAGLGGLLVAPPLAVAVPVAGWAHRRLRHLQEQRREARRVADALPEAVDLLLLCTGAGWTLPVAHPKVARRLPPPLGPALTEAAVATDRGTPRADALLDALAPFGERARALGQVLADHLRYGVALLPSLERLSLELRLDRRRQAEVEARRVPVRLLGPLVVCVLPAFALLTVVPLLVASLRALPA